VLLRLVTSALLGLCVGSFLNVVIWRVPRHLSVVRPRSSCPGCDTVLAGRELVPVVSWLALRGRCRWCGRPIAWRYPAVELGTALLFTLLAIRFPSPVTLVAYAVLAAALVALSAIDLELMVLPRRLIGVTGAAGVVLLTAAALVAGEPDRLLGALVGVGAGLAIVGGIHFVAPRSMGFGDVRLAALIGGYLGWLGLPHVLVGLFLAFLAGTVVGTGLVASGRLRRGSAVPFGPFLACGALGAVLVGEPLVRLWLAR
jgi:leader peptidase (prepilin peptidase)/N-methyltransferase